MRHERKQSWERRKQHLKENNCLGVKEERRIRKKWYIKEKVTECKTKKKLER